MKKLLIAAALASLASGALAQVGLGGGVVGTLGANGSASRFGGMGSGISTGATLRGADLRQTGQLSMDATAHAPKAATSGNAGGGIDTSVKPEGVKVDGKAGGGASAATPIVGGTSWGSAEASAGATTPDVKDTVRQTKSTARQKVDGLEERRDQIESRGDKKVDKTLQ
jgi:hypothetical protein